MAMSVSGDALSTPRLFRLQAIPSRRPCATKCRDLHKSRLTHEPTSPWHLCSPYLAAATTTSQAQALADCLPLPPRSPSGEQSNMEMMQRIIRADYVLPPHKPVSAECADLIRRLLTLEPSHRITIAGALGLRQLGAVLGAVQRGPVGVGMACAVGASQRWPLSGDLPVHGHSRALLYAEQASAAQELHMQHI